MFDYNISGIQQIGIGVEDLEVACSWYAKHFGMDLPIFKDEAEAALMSQFTGGKVHTRKAVLTMNLQGGGGFEVWQFTSRKPAAAKNTIHEGDLGISHIHLRAKNIEEAYQYFSKLRQVKLKEIETNNLAKKWFELTDPFNNKFKIIEDDFQFISTESVTGGVMGATIGVSDIDKALVIYQNAMQYDTILKETDSDKLATTWIAPTKSKASAFSELLGPTKLELVCAKAEKRISIYNNRFWGDLGFIHICFDVQRMNQLRKKAAEINFPFKVDSENSFDMGEAAGQFAYIQDEDETLIELV